MKLKVTLMLLACANLALADDQPAAKARPARSDSSTSTSDTRATQPVVRRPVAPAVNPNLRPVNPNPNPAYRVPRNRFVTPNMTPSRPGLTNRGVVMPNQRPNVATNSASNANRANRVRIPRRTGNELSFSQAQAEWSRHRHDGNWWRNHHTRICFYGGGYWFWNAGWWFPALGYSPYYANYVYDGPIPGYGELSPGDVTAQVQEALAQQGYYYGPIDGVLGPETRDAILRFQADHGLATTAAIDEPTLDSLGLT
jgi:hypothetical protein